jgi:hypothetical protein
MTPRAKKTYTKEFRIQALNLAKELGSYAEAARKLASFAFSRRNVIAHVGFVEDHTIPV